MSWAVAMLLFVGLASGMGDGPATEVVITAHGVAPSSVRVRPDERVVFVNRSGRELHIDLVGDAEQHHVFRVSGEIWAIFHQPGRHASIVDFEDPGGGRLRGVVDVTEDSESGSLPLTSSTVTVMDICLEP
jgi:hypothetical protein